MPKSKRSFIPHRNPENTSSVYNPYGAVLFDYKNLSRKPTFQKSKRKINHYGDWLNYPISNKLYAAGVKPGRDIDKDGDGIVDWEDCDPYDATEQGIWSTITSGVKSFVSTAAKVVTAPVSITKAIVSAAVQAAAPKTTTTQAPSPAPSPVSTPSVSSLRTAVSTGTAISSGGGGAAPTTIIPTALGLQTPFGNLLGTATPTTTTTTEGGHVTVRNKITGATYAVSTNNPDAYNTDTTEVLSVTPVIPNKITGGYSLGTTKYTSSATAEDKALATKTLSSGYVSTPLSILAQGIPEEKILPATTAPMPEGKKSIGAVMGLPETAEYRKEHPSIVMKEDFIGKGLGKLEEFRVGAAEALAPVWTFGGELAGKWGWVKTPEQVEKEHWLYAPIKDPYTGEVVGMKTVSPSEAEIIKAQAKVEATAKADAQALKDKYAAAAKAEIERDTLISQINADAKVAELQNKVNSGSMDVDEANKQLKNFIDNENTNNQAKSDKIISGYNSQIKNDFDKITVPKLEEIQASGTKQAETTAKAFQHELNMETIGYSFASGVGIGLVSLIPGVAPILAPVGYASLAISAPEIIQSFATDPWGTAANSVTFIAGGASASVAGGGIKGTIAKNQFKIAAEKSPLTPLDAGTMKIHLKDMVDNLNVKTTDIKIKPLGKFGNEIVLGDTGNSILQVIGKKVIQGKTYVTRIELPITTTAKGIRILNIPEKGLTTTYALPGEPGKAIRVSVSKQTGMANLLRTAKAYGVSTSDIGMLKTRMPGKVSYGEIKTRPILSAEMKFKTTPTKFADFLLTAKPGEEMKVLKVSKIKLSKEKPYTTPTIGVVKPSGKIPGIDAARKFMDILGVKAEKILIPEKVARALTPEEFAKNLAKEGKILYRGLKPAQFKEFLRRTGREPGADAVHVTNVRTGERMIIINEGIKLEPNGAKTFQTILAHELVHYMTPKTLLRIGHEIVKPMDLITGGRLPADLRPNEFPAYRFQSRVARSGFKAEVPRISAAVHEGLLGTPVTRYLSERIAKTGGKQPSIKITGAKNIIRGRIEIIKPEAPKMEFVPERGRPSPPLPPEENRMTRLLLEGAKEIKEKAKGIVEEHIPQRQQLMLQSAEDQLAQRRLTQQDVQQITKMKAAERISKMTGANMMANLLPVASEEIGRLGMPTIRGAVKTQLVRAAPQILVGSTAASVFMQKMSMPQIQKLSATELQKVVQVQKISPVQVQKIGTTQIQKITQTQKLAQAQIQKMVTPIVSVPQFIIPGIVPPFAGGGGGGGGKGRGGAAQLAAQRKAYMPSFSSVMLGERVKLTKAQLKALGKRKWTGLEIRPLVG
jgi:hypothetical protein